MSDFLKAFAAHMRVTPRTVRRWCAKGLVPGVYRSRGGHWRLRKRISARHSDIPFSARSSFRWRIAEAIFFYQRGSQLPAFGELRNLLALDSAAKARFSSGDWKKHLIASDLSMAMHVARSGMTEEEFRKTPEGSRLLYAVPIQHFIIPEARRAAAENPKGSALVAAAMALKHREEKVSATAVAKELKLPRATFYRRYSLGEIRRALAETRIG